MQFKYNYIIWLMELNTTFFGISLKIQKNLGKFKVWILLVGPFIHANMSMLSNQWFTIKGLIPEETIVADNWTDRKNTNVGSILFDFDSKWNAAQYSYRDLLPTAAERKKVSYAISE